MATLFWTAPEGPENQQVQAFNSGQGGMRMVARALAQSDVLPAGSTAGQLLYYNAITSSWVATPTAPADGQMAQWDAAANAWKFVAAPASAVGVVVSQIGWSSIAASNVLQLMPAGHTPGQYEVCLTLVVRTVALTASNANVTWTSPTFGAENKTVGQSMQINGLGTSTNVTGTTSIPLRCFALMSDGAAAITLQMTGAGGGLVDIYASARLIAI